MEATQIKSQSITGEELYEMGDIGPSELVEGRVVQMSPTSNEHGEVELSFGVALHTFVRAHKLGKVQSGEVGIYTHRNPDTVRAADVLFISNKRFAQQKSRGYLEVAPELIVEILSPSDRWTEVTNKLREYFSIGVRLVWVVDPEAQIVYAYKSLTEVKEFHRDDELPGDDVLPGFSVKVADLFGD